MTRLGDYISRMTPENVWPAAHSPADAERGLLDVEDPAAVVLTWRSNARRPMDDMLAAWYTLGLITLTQAEKTSAARQVQDRAFLDAYRASPPQPGAGQLAEMHNAFRAGAVNHTKKTS